MGKSKKATEYPAVRGHPARDAPGQLLRARRPQRRGKSTLFSLILRFYDPDTGYITLDGIDFRRAHAGIAARQHRRRQPGHLPLPRHHPREHPLRPARRHGRGDHRGREEGARPRVHHPAGERLRNRGRRHRQQALRRPEAAHLHRARHPAQCARSCCSTKPLPRSTRRARRSSRRPFTPSPRARPSSPSPTASPPSSEADQIVVMNNGTRARRRAACRTPPALRAVSAPLRPPVPERRRRPRARGSGRLTRRDTVRGDGCEVAEVVKFSRPHRVQRIRSSYFCSFRYAIRSRISSSVRRFTSPSGMIETGRRLALHDVLDLHVEGLPVQADVGVSSRRAPPVGRRCAAVHRRGQHEALELRRHVAAGLQQRLQDHGPPTSSTPIVERFGPGDAAQALHAMAQHAASELRMQEDLRVRAPTSGLPGNLVEVLRPCPRCPAWRRPGRQAEQRRIVRRRPASSRASSTSSPSVFMALSLRVDRPA